MKPNTELLNKVLEYIETHEANWRQNDWALRLPACRTSACFAGWTVLLSGYDLVFEREHDTSWQCVKREGNGYVHRIPVIAQILLNLNSADASELFACNNTLDDLRRMVKVLSDEGTLAE